MLITDVRKQQLAPVFQYPQLVRSLDGFRFFHASQRCGIAVPAELAQAGP